MVLDTKAHVTVQRAVMDARNSSARARRAFDARRELASLRSEVVLLRRRHASDRNEIARLSRELEALQEALGTE